MRLKKGKVRAVSDQEDKTENKTFWEAIKAFFKSISIKVKLIFGTIVGVFGVISIFLLSKRLNSRQILELELKKVRKEIEIEIAQEEIDRNQEKLLELESKAEDIKEQIEMLDKPDPEREISNEELDNFFDERGF